MFVVCEKFRVWESMFFRDLRERGSMFVTEKDIVISALLNFEVSTEWNVKWEKCCVICQA